MWDEKSIEVMEWPACSPDLNPIENVWGWMVRKLYAKGKNYGSKNDLKKSIIELWGKSQVIY